MDPVSAGTLLGGVAQVAGVGANVFGQSSANAANEEVAKKNRDFQAAMSNTQYQRGVADLEAAGLNPLLAVTNGMSAGTASGASYTEQNPYAGVSGEIGGAVGSAMQYMRLQHELDNIDSSSEANRASAAKSYADAGLSPKQALDLVASAKLKRAQAGATAEQARKTRREADKLAIPAALGRVADAAIRSGAEAVPSPTPYRSPTPTRPW